MGSTNSKVFGSTRVVVKYWKELVVKYLPAVPVVTYFLPIRHRTLSRRDRQTRLLFLLFISSSLHSQFFLTSFKSALLLFKALFVTYSVKPSLHVCLKGLRSKLNSIQQPTWHSDLSLKLNLIEKVENSIDYRLFPYLPPPPH